MPIWGFDSPEMQRGNGWDKTHCDGARREDGVEHEWNHAPHVNDDGIDPISTSQTVTARLAPPLCASSPFEL
jgi:hypothetical protein